MDQKLISVGVLVLAIASRFTAPSPTQLSETNKDSIPHIIQQIAKPSEQKDVEIVPLSERGPWYATCQFINPDPTNLKALGERVLLTTRPPDSANSRDKWCLPAHGKYQFLFATVPDPVDSHLALDFDRRIEAITDAAQSMGFSYDRFWLPWDPGYSVSQDSAIRREKILRESRAQEPGLLLFRNSRHPDLKELLLVFLIGETPTAGIHRIQMANAMRYMGEIDNSQYEGPSEQKLLAKTIRVLGPSFSGSAYSLRSLLAEFHCIQTKCFHLISSSATHRASLDWLKELPVIHLEEVLHDDHEALSQFVRFTHDRLHYKEKEVALLTEDTTDYGKMEKPRDPSDRAEESSILQIYFPREIAQLRNAYPETTTINNGSKDVSVPQQGLTLTLKGRQTSQDDVPPFSGAQLPFSQEAVLLNIASTLRREQIRFVGIFATDIFDTLFLSRFLRVACPDIRIFAIQGNLLVVRAAETIPLQGSLAITTYPLIARNQDWTATSLQQATQRNLLASAPMQATFNATVGLLRDIPDASGWLLEYSSPFNLKIETPPLWLTVVGHDGYWPLTLLDEDKSGMLHPSLLTPRSQLQQPTTLAVASCNPKLGPKEAFECEHVPVLWSLVCGLFSCWSMVYLLAVWSAIACQKKREYFKKNWFSTRCKFDWLEDFAVKESDGQTADRAFYLVIESLILAISFLFLVAPAWKIYDFETYPVLSFVALVLILLLVATAGGLSWYFLRFRLADQLSHRTTWLVFAWILFLALCALQFFSNTHFLDSTFFAYRSLDLASGVAPTTPFVLLLAAFSVWARVHMHRLRYSESRRPVLPSASFDLISYSHFGGMEDSFEKAIREMFGYRRFLSTTAVFIIAFVLFDPPRYLRSLEGRWFDAAFIFCFGLLYFVIFSNWLRFLLGWSILHRFLRLMERQPLRFAFGRLPSEFSWGPIWKQGGTRRTKVLFIRSLDYLRALGNTALPDALGVQFKELCASIEDSTQSVLKDDAEGRWDKASKIATLQKQLASAADALLREPLLQHWTASQTDLLKAPPQDMKGESDPDRTIHLAEEFVALRCLAFIRYASLQLRNLLGFLTTAFILSLISVHSYPFQAPHTIGWSMTVIFIILGGGIVITFAQMDRDAILSRISCTAPGKLDKEFALRLISFGTLPLLTVLASQFPSIGRFLFSWVQPGLEALR